MNDSIEQPIMIIPMPDGGFKFFPQENKTIAEWLEYMRTGTVVDRDYCGAV